MNEIKFNLLQMKLFCLQVFKIGYKNLLKNYY
jgi:hypothetical protein